MSMKNIKKLSAIAMATVFATMQVTFAAEGLSNASIKNTVGGFDGMTTGTNSATLHFKGDTQVNWNTLNVNKNETLNFNANDGVSGIKVLNTVETGMSKIYGQINANDGISQLIIANPNGMLFDGASFNAAGDVMLTTKDVTLSNIDNASYGKVAGTDGRPYSINIQNGSEFNVGGKFNIYAPIISADGSTITADTLKLVTANGQDYIGLGYKSGPSKTNTVTSLKSVNINGDIIITNDVGALAVTDGGTFNGNFTSDTNGNVTIGNIYDASKEIKVSGDMNAKANGSKMFIRSTTVGGNLVAENGGGFLDAGNIDVKGNANLTTTERSLNSYGGKVTKHFVHVVGDSSVDGNLNIDSVNNIHIGNYSVSDSTTLEGQLLDGSLTVGGDLTAHAKDGHVMTTINTKADKIAFTSDNYNVLTSKDTELSAKEYQFSSNGYIGSIKDSATQTDDQQIINIMENYKFIPKVAENPEYMTIAGGKVTKIVAPENAEVYIASKGDMELTGANAGNVNITAKDSRIDITGPDVHAKNINVGPETDTLKVEFDGRDYTLNYTNIRDEKVVTVNPTDKITYELTNGDNGYNIKTPRAKDTTYLVGPDRIDPVPPPPQPQPEPVIDDTENARVLETMLVDPDAGKIVAAPVNTAYAADLDDDDIDTGVRKNVDGSVTVVRAFAME